MNKELNLTNEELNQQKNKIISENDDLNKQLELINLEIEKLSKKNE